MLKKLFQRLTTPVSELDRDRLRVFCESLPGVSPIGSAVARQEITVVGEIASVRIVPRAGSPSLEATIADGSGSITAIWTGRRRIAGVSPGKRLVLSGRGTAGPSGRLAILNPRYELI